MNVVAVVEGEGEVAALPLLLRRIAAWRTPDRPAQVLAPIRVRRDRFLNRADESSRYLQLAAAKAGANGWILVVFDSDGDCPAELGSRVRELAGAVIPHRAVSVVLANCEYEAWFIAAAESLDGHRGFSFDPDAAIDAERPRDAKGYIKSRMTGGSYGETTDQPAFSALIDLEAAHRNSRSFRKLCAEWDRHIALA